jgi:serine/threonine-protein kinase
LSLPRIRARLADNQEIADVLRAALLHSETIVPLETAPLTSGQHLLEIDVPGDGIITVLADPAGHETDEGHLLSVKPITRPQMATIFAIVERLDEPTRNQSIAPTNLDAEDDIPESEGGAEADSTMVQPMLFNQSDLPPPPKKPGSLAPSSNDDAPASLVLLPEEMPASLIPSSQALISRAPGSAPTSSQRTTGEAAPGALRVSMSPSSDKDKDPLIGRVIAGKYKIESLIGSGASAAVYRGTHQDLNRAVAVKVLHKQNMNDAQFVQRFKGEARAASKLEHANVARVMDFGNEPDGLLYLVMEYLEGRSLEAILAASGKLTPAVAIDLVLQACAALAFAHDVGIIHRDIKPENMMLVGHRDEDGNPTDLVKVCDFGLAKLRDPDPDAEDLTTAGMLCGSPAYMSPEQSRGEKLDVRTDVYSLGVMLYECLTGDFPHDANSLTELFLKKMTEAPRPLKAKVPDIDEVLEAAVLKAIATDREQRFATVRAMRDELRKARKRLEAPAA